MNLPLLRQEADMKKTRLKELATVLETRALTELEEKEVDAEKKNLIDLSTKIDRAEYLAQVAKEKVESNPDAEEKRFANSKRSFSVANVIAKAGGHGVDTGREDEITQELKRNDPYATGDYIVPWEALSRTQSPLEKREITTTQLAAGELNPDDTRPDLIPLLRDALALAQAGAGVITGATSKLVIPRQKTKATASWLAETGTVSDSNITFDNVSADPKKLMALTSWSALSALESRANLEQIARADLIADLASAIDMAALYGQTLPKKKADAAVDQNEPLGITAIGKSDATKNGVPTTLVTRTGDNAENGAALTYAEVLKLAEDADSANLSTSRRAFICNPKTRYAMMQALQQTAFTSSDGYIWNGGGLAGMPTVVTNEVVSDRVITTDAAKTTGSDLFYGAWNAISIVTWGSGVNLLANPLGTGYSSGAVQLRALVFANIIVRYNNAVKWYRGIKA